MRAPTPERILAPAGTFPARVYSIIYMGTVKGEYKGTPTSSYRVRLSWELPTKTRKFKEDEPAKPFSVSKELTLSMGSKSNLRPIVEGMLGVSFTDDDAKSFDIDELLGKDCLINLTHKESPNGKYVAINSTSQLPEGMTCPAAVNPAKILSYEKFDKDYFLTLPKFIKEKMEKTPEFIKMNGGQVETIDDYLGETIDPNSIPF